MSIGPRLTNKSLGPPWVRKSAVCLGLLLRSLGHTGIITVGTSHMNSTVVFRTGVHRPVKRAAFPPLYTPLSGSWLNMAESVQRIVCGRALNGQHPQTAAEIITWLEDTVAGWNAAPTPFVWDGKRRERRLRAKQRRLGGSAAILADHQLIAA